jgi:hypothetical protein
VFYRMAVMLRNIHFGGALSGNEAIRFSQSMFCNREPKSLRSPASPTNTAASTKAFFMTEIITRHDRHGQGRRSRVGVRSSPVRGLSVSPKEGLRPD